MIGCFNDKVTYVAAYITQAFFGLYAGMEITAITGT
jgi:hypothetical protein